MFDPAAHIGVVVLACRRLWRWFRDPARPLDTPHLDDLSQEAMLQLVRVAGEYDPARGAPSTFAWTVARRAALSCIRRELWYNGRPEDDFAAPDDDFTPRPRVELTDPAPPPDEQAAAAEIGRLTDALAGALLADPVGVKERSLDIVRRRVGLGYEAHTLREVGRVYGLTQGSIRRITEGVYHKLRKKYLPPPVVR